MGDLKQISRPRLSHKALIVSTLFVSMTLIGCEKTSPNTDSSNEVSDTAVSESAVDTTSNSSGNSSADTDATLEDSDASNPDNTIGQDTNAASSPDAATQPASAGGMDLLSDEARESLITPPWQSRNPLPADKVPTIYSQAWQDTTANPNTPSQCRNLVLPDGSLANLQDATANIGSDVGSNTDSQDALWRVNYSIPDTPNAYGVAFLGDNLSTQAKWSDTINYDDGTWVQYGRADNQPDGDWQADILMDNGCLYQVWSKQSETHLLNIINGLRRVEH